MKLPRRLLLTPLGEASHLQGTGGYSIPGLSQFFVVEKPFIAYKKVAVRARPPAWHMLGRIVITLAIPAGALVHISQNEKGQFDKCRASEAVILDKFGSRRCVSTWDHEFKYPSRARIEPDNDWFDHAPVHCGSGIHFFLKRSQALAY